MKMPGCERAVVDMAKVSEYLLNAEHPDNGGKAQFFFSLGFSRASCQVLIDSLGSVAVTGAVVKTVETPHGSKYIIDGRIASPAGREAGLRTVWVVDRGQQSPRLVTAYPLEE